MTKTRTHTRTHLPNTITTLPTTLELTHLPVAESGSYTLNAQQVSTLRQRIYKLNADNVRGWRWRSAKVPIGKGMFTLIVWRLS